MSIRILPIVASLRWIIATNVKSRNQQGVCLAPLLGMGLPGVTMKPAKYWTGRGRVDGSHRNHRSRGASAILLCTPCGNFVPHVWRVIRLS